MTAPHEIHNRLVPDLLRQIVTQAGSEADANVIMESLLLGFLLFYRPGGQAVEFLDVITERTATRLLEIERGGQ